MHKVLNPFALSLSKGAWFDKLTTNVNSHLEQALKPVLVSDLFKDQ